MPILMLAQGDQAAKNMLGKLIVNRYGLRPPALENLIIDFQGQIPVKTDRGIRTIPLDATAMFNFPNAMRWDFVVRYPDGRTIQNIEAFDGILLHEQRHQRPAHVVTHVEHLHGIIGRLWSMAAVLVTPLSDSKIQLTAHSSRAFYAQDTRFGDAIMVRVGTDHRIECVQALCYNPATAKEQVYSLLPSTDLVEIDGLPLPKTLRAYWDEDLLFELQPVAAEAGLEVPQSMFRLVYEAGAGQS